MIECFRIDRSHRSQLEKTSEIGHLEWFEEERSREEFDVRTGNRAGEKLSQRALGSRHEDDPFRIDVSQCLEVSDESLVDCVPQLIESIENEDNTTMYVRANP